MKKFAPVFLCVLALALVFCAVPQQAEATTSGTCGDNLTWTLDDAYTLTISGTGPMGEYDWHSYPWVASQNDLLAVVIEEGVTTIGDNVFAWCANLRSVTIPEGVTSIGKNAFFECESLISITFPDSLTAIGESAFDGCASLTSLTIPAGVTTIEEDTFCYCTSLTSVSIPASVTTIGESAFFYCNKLTDVYYGGSEDMWKQIGIAIYNNPLTKATIHYGQQEESDYVPGDLDGVPGILVDDAIFLLQHILMPQQFPVNQPADIDGNGQANVDDAIYLLQHVLMPGLFPL